MSYEHICNLTKQIMRKYNETNPFEICRKMGIMVHYAKMGTAPGSCKGFFLYQSRISSITINSDLSPAIQRIIGAHELGHALLHRKCVGIKAFHDFSLFDNTSKYEREANIFAAEFLLDDEEVMATLNDDMTFFQAASKLNVPAELLDFKFRTMKWKGYKLVDGPIQASSDFLKKIPTDGGDYDG